MSKRTFRESLVQVIAEAAADAVLPHGTTCSAMIEYAGEEWQALEELIASQSKLTDPIAREQDAQVRAFYEIGMAVGRRIGGAR